MSEKTLIILTPAFPADESDDESIWVPAKQRLIRCINRLYPALEIIILSFQFPQKKGQYYWENNLVIPFGGGNTYGKKNWLMWISVFLQLKKLRGDKNIVGVLSFWCAECAFVGHYFSKLYGYKHLCWISGQDAKAENKFVKRIRPEENELVGMSDFLIEEFAKNHQIRPAHLIPDAIDPMQFNVLEKQDRYIDIIGVGGLSPLKQYDIFIEIIADLKLKFPTIKVHLCGDGSERKKLEDLIEKKDLKNNVTLTGKISQENVFNFMQRSKILLHTSAYEGFGNVCIEALYAGAKVISFTQPMKQHIPHWYHVTTIKEMTHTILQVLADKNVNYTSTLPFDMHDSVKRFMQLFLEHNSDLSL